MRTERATPRPRTQQQPPRPPSAPHGPLQCIDAMSGCETCQSRAWPQKYRTRLVRR